MAQPKTQKTKESVAAFIASIEDETRRKDAKAVDKLLREVTGEKPAMWGTSIVGYGQYQSATGKWPRAGFAPRKGNLVLYVMPGFSEYQGLLAKLGKHKTGKSCLYLNRIEDVNGKVLRELVARSWRHMKKYD